MGGPYYSTVTIVPGNNPNEIIFQEIYYIQGSELPATVDLEAGTVTFKSIENWCYMENYQGWADFQLYQWNTYHTRASKISEYSATIAADGTGNILFDPDIYIEIVVPEGINPNPGFPGNDNDDKEPSEQLIANLGSKDDVNLYFQAINRPWIYEADEWEYAGKASFQDGWIAPFLGYNTGSETLIYLVDYYTNKQNPDKILIADPYDNTAYTTTSNVGYKNTGSGKGYIYIDTSNPGFVELMKGVPSGYSCETLGSDIECYNLEGYFLCTSGYDISTIKSTMNYFGYNSYSARTGDKIEIRNLDLTSSLYAHLYAGVEGGPSMGAVTYITLNVEDIPDQPGNQTEVNAMPEGVETASYHFTYYSQPKSMDVTGNVAVAFQDSKVYFQGLLPAYPEFVVYGDLNDETDIISIPQKQLMGINKDGNEVYVTYIVFNGWTGAWEYPEAPAAYQLRLTEDGRMVAVSQDAYSNEYLAFRTTESYLDYVMNVNIEEGELPADPTWSVEGKTEYTMPVGVEILPYQFSGAFEYNLGRETSLVDVAFQDNYIYVNGLSYHMPQAVVRIEYNEATGKYYIPQTQLVGYYGGEPYFTRVYTYNFSTGGISALPIDTAYELVMQEDGTLMCPQGDAQYWYVGFYNPNVKGESAFAYGCLELIGNLRLTPYVDRSGTPANAYGLEYDAVFNEFNFMLPNYTTDNVDMNTGGLYYEIYVNGIKLYFEGPEQDEDGPYMGTYGTDMLWYGQSNGIDIIANGMGHTIVIYEEPVETLGVRSVYTYSDILNPSTTTYSETMTLDVASGEITTGVMAFSGNADVISTEYYTIGGQRVNNPENGVYIMRSTLSDGKVIVSKVIR